MIRLHRKNGNVDDFGTNHQIMQMNRRDGLLYSRRLIDVIPLGWWIDRVRQARKMYCRDEFISSR
ncbi:hypothetical protein EDC14_10626 [Hydrogenispora ethanolica]|uniref:Uncharacterized protein n=1 Tax=Hydrogenispora ethanolica TaxID=1082276 RepID=A0A4R1QMS9_HYDET|nr:hypothetical protein EDC14_10626 [Hydrogenispora ethanolica]